MDIWLVELGNLRTWGRLGVLTVLLGIAGNLITTTIVDYYEKMSTLASLFEMQELYGRGESCWLRWGLGIPWLQHPQNRIRKTFHGRKFLIMRLYWGFGRSYHSKRKKIMEFGKGKHGCLIGSFLPQFTRLFLGLDGYNLYSLRGSLSLLPYCILFGDRDIRFYQLITCSIENKIRWYFIGT